MQRSQIYILFYFNFSLEIVFLVLKIFSHRFIDLHFTCNDNYFNSFSINLCSIHFCSATLSFVIILICVMCYCFNRSINKSSMALYRQRIMQSMNEHNVDIYTVEQVNMNISYHFVYTIQRTFYMYILCACQIDENVTQHASIHMFTYLYCRIHPI